MTESKEHKEHVKSQIDQIVSNIINKDISEEMKSSYIDYSMSVIVGRALPDVRDGLKPVHRRILYTMDEMGLKHNKPYKKSARVVGDVLGKYHPHGDMAVYDSLVRMVQPFSLRHPLIDGQGNFGCFTKDTKVKLTDGRDLTFEDLIREHKKGKKNYTYTVNADNNIEIAEIRNPRMTQKQAQIMKVVLDNETEIKCTLNHKFMLMDGSYKEAKFLKPGDSLMPLYLRLSNEKDGFKPELLGYQMIYVPLQNKWVSCHILGDEWNLKHEVYTKSAGRIRHHVDFNKLNNNPDNIKRIHWSEHWNLHKETAVLQHQNVDYREKIALGRKKFWSKPENRQKYSERMSERNMENWKNLEYKEKMRKFLSEVNKEYVRKNPRVREIYSKRASKTLIKLWRDPTYRELFHQKIVKANKNRITNSAGRVKFLKICSHILKKHNKISEILYENARKEIFKTSFPNWRGGVSKYFSNDINMIFYELHKNHKVKKIEITNHHEDVYDLTIEDTHNFALSAGIFVHNSVDGDPAAAMRYTEVRLAQVADEMLSDIEKETVKFGPNYDSSMQEPLVLPSKLPNLLVNGSSGIAVGMATNIPTHNLSEICDVSIAVINNPEITVKELMKTVKGPDFPTGAIIRGRQGIKDYFETGRGSIKIQAKTDIEDIKGGRQAIIVNEIPYQVNKSVLIESIANLVRNKKIGDISDIRDESDRRGMRIVIEIKRDGNAQVVLNQLYKHTQMETSFGVIMLAIVDGRPKVLSLKDVILQHIKHRKSVITDRTKYDLKKALQRAHILEGFLIAIKNLDAVIAIIKKSKDAQEAKQKLMSQFALTEIQAQAILDMRLHQLTKLETGQIEEEHKGLLKLIEELKGILADYKKVLKIIVKEFEELKAKYREERKTQITSEATELAIEDLIPEEKVVIIMSHSGYIKRIPADTYKVQGRGGKGVIGSDVREEDFIEHLFVTSSHATILLFTSRGKAYPLKGYEIPEGNRTSRGKAVINLLPVKDEKITSVIAIESFEEAKGRETYIVMCTRKGKIKKILIKNFANIRKSGIIAIGLEDGDVLTGVGHTTGKYEIMIGTKDGMSIRFPESNIRAMGRGAKGVKGMRLGKNDQVVGMEVVEPQTKKTLLTVCENGYGKRTDLDEYRNQRRAGSGVITIKATERNGNVLGIKLVSNEDHLMVMTEKGQIIRMACKGIRTISRNTQGVRLVNLEEGDKIAGIEPIVEESAEAENSA